MIGLIRKYDLNNSNPPSLSEIMKGEPVKIIVVVAMSTMSRMEVVISYYI
jgi:hypothetical protein